MAKEISHVAIMGMLAWTLMIMNGGGHMEKNCHSYLN